MATFLEEIEAVDSALQELAREPLAPRSEGDITGLTARLDALLRSPELAKVRQLPSPERAARERGFQRVADKLRFLLDVGAQVERPGGETPSLLAFAEAAARIERQLREQIAAIKQAAQAEIDIINAGRAVALRNNALAQLETYITIAAQAGQLGKPDEARKELLESMRTVFREVSEPGWDGYDALPVSGGTLAKALAFLHLLPSALIRPEISAHPDGELAFEWYVGPRWLLTISISEAGRLSYAGLFGTARVHGTEWLLDNSIPQPVALAFERFLSGITAA